VEEFGAGDLDGRIVSSTIAGNADDGIQVEENQAGDRDAPPAVGADPGQRGRPRQRRRRDGRAGRVPVSAAAGRAGAAPRGAAPACFRRTISMPKSLHDRYAGALARTCSSAGAPIRRRSERRAAVGGTKTCAPARCSSDHERGWRSRGGGGPGAAGPRARAPAARRSRGSTRAPRPPRAPVSRLRLGRPARDESRCGGTGRRTRRLLPHPEQEPGGRLHGGQEAVRERQPRKRGAARRGAAAGRRRGRPRRSPAARRGSSQCSASSEEVSLPADRWAPSSGRSSTGRAYVAR
jgi:hypothetical protein